MRITSEKQKVKFKLGYCHTNSIMVEVEKKPTPERPDARVATTEIYGGETEKEKVSLSLILYNILCGIVNYTQDDAVMVYSIVKQGSTKPTYYIFHNGKEYTYDNANLPIEIQEPLSKDINYLKNPENLLAACKLQLKQLKEFAIKPLSEGLPDIEQETKLNEVVTIVEPLEVEPKQPEPKPISNQKTTEKEPSILDMINGYVSIIGNDKLSINERGEANLKLSVLLFTISDILRQLKEAENDADAEYRAVKLEKFKEFRKICELSEKGEKYSNEAAKTYAENETLHLKNVLNKCEAAVMYYRNIKSDIENTIKSAITVISTEKATNNNQSNKQV